MRKQTIVIDREYGSGGREVARILSEKLGIRFYDGELLSLASEKYGIDLGAMKDFDEKRVGSLLYSLAMAANCTNNYEKLEMPYKIYNAQAKLMRHLVAEGPCIFLGRCAGEILKDETPLLQVFIYADDIKQKIRRIVELDGVPERDAQSSLHRKDAERKNYYHYFTKKEWGSRQNYDLCLNTSALGYERAANAIIAAMK